MQQRRRQWLVWAGLAGVVVFGPGIYEVIRLSLIRHRLDRQLAALNAEHERLAQERRRLTSDAVYVEGLIRSTFKVAQPGELVVPLKSASSSSTHRETR